MGRIPQVLSTMSVSYLGFKVGEVRSGLRCQFQLLSLPVIYISTYSLHKLLNIEFKEHLNLVNQYGGLKNTHHVN